MNEMLGRMKRAVMLDATLYQEVESDSSLNQEALLVVILTAFAGGLGALLSGLLGLRFGQAILGALVTIVLGVVNYYIWSYVTYWVGTTFFDGTAVPGELLRGLGYAHTPLLLGLLSFVPFIGWVFPVAGLVLTVITAVVAIREALDFDTGKAVITGLIGAAIVAVIRFVVWLIFRV